MTDHDLSLLIADDVEQNLLALEAVLTPLGHRLVLEGPGIPPSQMARMFGMFERAADGPSPTTGLGLAICRRVVARLGGRIWMSVLFSLPAGTR